MTLLISRLQIWPVLVPTYHIPTSQVAIFASILHRMQFGEDTDDPRGECRGEERANPTKASAFKQTRFCVTMFGEENYLLICGTNPDTNQDPRKLWSIAKQA